MSAKLAQTKFSVTTNFLFSLSSLHALNKGIFHEQQQQKTPHGINKNAAHALNQRTAKSPTGQATFWVKFPHASQMPGDCPGGRMGDFGID